MPAPAEFFDAIRARDLLKITSLLKESPQLAGSQNAQGVSAVLTAVYSGSKEIRDRLLAEKPDLSLEDAAATGNLARVREIVEQKPSLAKSFSPDGFAVVALACVFGHLDVARYLAERGADINTPATNGTGYNALTGAVASGHLAIVQWLLASGANVNYRYSAGYSPLLTAAANGNVAVVRLLLEHGADAAAKTNDGKTALVLAEERKHPEVVDILRKLGL